MKGCDGFLSLDALISLLIISTFTILFVNLINIYEIKINSPITFETINSDFINKIQVLFELDLVNLIILIQEIVNEFI